jgi:hypothetical protein
MASSNWQISGEYFETCNCDFLCPCVTSNLTARPTKGDCKVALAFHVKQGNFDGVKLDGLNFVVVAMTPGPMAEGNWTVGLVVDEKADDKQREALTGIASGQAGGPMAGLGPLIGNFAGVETHPIRFEKTGMKCSLSVPGLVEQAVEGVTSPASPNEPMALDHTAHPVNPRIALAKSTGSMFNVFGIRLDDQGGANNGHYAPFNWKSA